jgi:hypothetical protein
VGSRSSTIAGGPPIVVLADRRRLGQILSTSSPNGVRCYRPEGTVTLSATANDDRARIRVRDTGVGIAADQLRRSLNPETMRGDHTTPQSQLGLALSSRLAGLMAAPSTPRATSGRAGVRARIPLATGAAADPVGVRRSGARPARGPYRPYIEDNLANLHLVEASSPAGSGSGSGGDPGRMGLELARDTSRPGPPRPPPA